MPKVNMPKVHDLKCDPIPFVQTRLGWKTSEIRYDDRNYQTYDYLLLRQTEHTGAEMSKDDNAMPMPLKYTGHCILAKITHIYREQGMKDSWLVLSIKVLDRFPACQ